MKKLILCIWCLFFCSRICSENYEVLPDPFIDVIIPCTDKDLDLLDLCIEGIRENCSQVRRIIVISDRPLTDKAEWFDENLFPFNKEAIAYYLLKCNVESLEPELVDVDDLTEEVESTSLTCLQKVKEYLEVPKPRVGWYFQQLLKLYAPYWIPGISSNVLCLDSDTVFLNSVLFIDSEGKPLYNPGIEYYRPYFSHLSRLIPGLKRVFGKYSGISHHMLLQREVLNELFALVESYHNMDFWKAFCFCVEESELFASGASEYELYFNFIFSKTNQAKLRFLKWSNVTSLEDMERYQRRGFHYISCHSYHRE